MPPRTLEIIFVAIVAKFKQPANLNVSGNPVKVVVEAASHQINPFDSASAYFSIYQSKSSMCFLRSYVKPTAILLLGLVCLGSLPLYCINLSAIVAWCSGSMLQPCQLLVIIAPTDYYYFEMIGSR